MKMKVKMTAKKPMGKTVKVRLKPTKTGGYVKNPRKTA
jgi:hypothetical protein